MMIKKFPAKILIPLLAVLILPSCTMKTGHNEAFTGAPGEVKLITLDPGHFHASLVQKSMYPMIDPVVKVYAPGGPELDDHLARLATYNQRPEDPTSWKEEIYTGTDFLEKMLSDRSGNLVVIAGNNTRKSKYIEQCISSGFNVLADKPMVISPWDFPILERSFIMAEEKGILLYDIMTERYEVSTMLQKAFSQLPSVFGSLVAGTPDDPAITKESVHHFSKTVSGKPLRRPSWFFDVSQQGEGIVDVTTHLVDLVQWEAFPDVILEKQDVEILSARRWTTALSPGMFRDVTGEESWPGYLLPAVENDSLRVYCNGEIAYKLRGIHARVSVIWNFSAPEGGGDTHFSQMRGSKSRLVIRQGREENWKPTLYVLAEEGVSLPEFEKAIMEATEQLSGMGFPGIKARKVSDREWSIQIPDNLRTSHEEHFSQVMEKFLGFLKEGKLPEWEVPNMLVKYYTTTEGMRLCK